MSNFFHLLISDSDLERFQGYNKRGRRPAWYHEIKQAYTDSFNQYKANFLSQDDLAYMSERAHKRGVKPLRYRQLLEREAKLKEDYEALYTQRNVDRIVENLMNEVLNATLMPNFTTKSIVVDASNINLQDLFKSLSKRGFEINNFKDMGYYVDIQIPGQDRAFFLSKTILDLHDEILGGLFEDESGSDPVGILISNLKDIDNPSLTFTIRKTTITTQLGKKGSFFPYYSTSVSIPHFQIYTKPTLSKDTNNDYTICLKFALETYAKVLDLPVQSFSIPVDLVKNGKVNKSDLGIVAKANKVCIRCYAYNDGNVTMTNFNYTKGAVPYIICVYKGHYMAYLKEDVRRNVRYPKLLTFQGQHYDNTLSLVTTMVDTKHFLPLDYSDLEQVGKMSLSSIDNEDYLDPNDCTPEMYKIQEAYNAGTIGLPKSKPKLFVFADFETITKFDRDEVHQSVIALLDSKVKEGNYKVDDLVSKLEKLSNKTPLETTVLTELQNKTGRKLLHQLHKEYQSMRAHKPYMVCAEMWVEGQLKARKEFRGFDCANQMMYWVHRIIPRQPLTCKTSGKVHWPTLTKFNKIAKASVSEDLAKLLYREPIDHVNLIFHNLSYDFHFLSSALNVQDVYGSLAKIKGAKASFYDLKINLRDSYQFHKDKLSNFPKLVGLDKTLEKEILPYDLYTTESVKLTSVPLKVALDLLRPEQRDTFLEQAKDYIHNGNFKHMDYSAKYCFRDVEVLSNCYLKLQDIYYDSLGLYIGNYYTPPALAREYFIRHGCLDNVTSLFGTVRKFVTKCAHGGRVLSHRQEKVNVKRKIIDLDARSLYPTAMKLICDKYGGIPIGKPSILPPGTLAKDLHRFPFAFVKVHVKKYGVNTNYPILSYLDTESGSKKYYFELPPEGVIVYLDPIALDNLKQFNQVKDEDLEIISGIYFPETDKDTINPKIGKVAEKIYKDRAELKRNKDPKEKGLKLILNAGYGVLMQKRYDTKLKIAYACDKDAYLAKHLHKLKSYTYLDDNHIALETESSGVHKNQVHIACLILSMSKYLMYEFSHCIEQVGGSVLYTDTDSCHIEAKYMTKAKQLWQTKMGYPLEGDDLGQFHSDFEVPGAKECVSNHLIVVGPKAYCHQLKCIGYDGKEWVTHHYRLKGVPGVCIEKYCSDHGLTPIQLYQKLYNGQKITFNLLDRPSPSFDSNNGKIYSMVKFERQVTF